MRSEAKQYRAKAEECARRADEATDPQVKAAFKEVEREWLEMARLSEEGACGKNFGGDAAADLAFQEQ
jgi:hypothetical protein